MVSDPGRTCPIGYRTRAADLRETTGLAAETLYVIGGLYGNGHALRAIEAMARQEAAAGLPPPTLAFNGDFNWFNAEPTSFRQINDAVADCHAVAGNVELELAEPSAGAGCGCAYPDWVDGETVECSNQIMQRLQGVAAGFPDIRERLSALPRHLVMRVAGLRIGIIHGDPDSVAGWGLAVENMPPPGCACPSTERWFREAGVDILACTHTCLAHMQDFTVDGRRCLVANNGAAGMPNFRGDRRGLLTRIGTSPSPFGCLYGGHLGDGYCEAVPVIWNNVAWEAWFKSVWPEGSPAARSYAGRLRKGPDHRPARACRLTGREAAGAELRSGDGFPAR